jgi:hypothetical protein
VVRQLWRESTLQVERCFQERVRPESRRRVDHGVQPVTSPRAFDDLPPARRFIRELACGPEVDGIHRNVREGQVWRTVRGNNLWEELRHLFRRLLEPLRNMQIAPSGSADGLPNTEGAG